MDPLINHSNSPDAIPILKFRRNGSDKPLFVSTPSLTHLAQAASTHRDVNRSSLVGYTVWPSCALLILFLSANTAYCNQFQTIYELGSGTGVLGVALSKLVKNRNIILSDTHHDVLEQCKTICLSNNIQPNTHPPRHGQGQHQIGRNSIFVVRHTWGGCPYISACEYLPILASILPSGGTQSHSSPSSEPIFGDKSCLILGADILFSSTCVDPVFASIRAAGAPCILVYEERDESLRATSYLTARLLSLTITVVWSAMTPLASDTLGFVIPEGLSRDDLVEASDDLICGSSLEIWLIMPKREPTRFPPDFPSTHGTYS